MAPESPKKRLVPAVPPTGLQHGQRSVAERKATGTPTEYDLLPSRSCRSGCRPVLLLKKGDENNQFGFGVGDDPLEVPRELRRACIFLLRLIRTRFPPFSGEPSADGVSCSGHLVHPEVGGRSLTIDLAGSWVGTRWRRHSPG